jgi:ribosome-associated heat shock protein Hsp15
MRIDKYLWCIRYYKTRSIATEACNKGQVSVNGQKVKPSKTIINGDEIIVRKDQINYKLKVLDIPASRLGAKLVDIYRLDTTTAEELLKLANLRSASAHYREKGVGRPTKKDRRDLEDYEEENMDWGED